MTIIVSDTRPIVHLKEAGLLELLGRTGNIHIPEMVDIEIAKLQPHWTKFKPEWIYTESLLPDEAKQAEDLFLSGLLDLGEAEAILLAKRFNPKWFLTDDTEARIFANSLGIEVHGSLGIVIWLAAVGHLNHIEAKDALIRLSRTALWVSKHILEYAQNALKEIFVEE